MALSDSSVFVYPRFKCQSTLTVSNFTINASGEKIGQIFQAPRTGSITGLSYKIGTVSIGGSFDVRLETVGANGQPSGTLATTNSNGASVITGVDANDWKEVTLTASHSATVGEWLALVVEWSSTADAQVGACTGSGGASSDSFQHLWYDSGGGYTSQAVKTMFGAASYSGAYYSSPGLWPHRDGTTTIVQDSIAATDSQLGLKFKAPFTARAIGVQLGDIPSVSAPFKFNLWDDTSTVIATVTVDNDIVDSLEFAHCLFTSAPTITAGKWYRLTIGSTTASGASMYEYEVASAALRDMIMVDAYKTESTTHPPTQESHWTDSTAICPNIAVMLDQIDSASEINIITRPRRVM